jgi:tight adherence protein B
VASEPVTARTSRRVFARLARALAAVAATAGITVAAGGGFAAPAVADSPGTGTASPGATAPAASAQPGRPAVGHIVQLHADPGTLQVLFTAVGLPTGESIDAASVRVTADGTPLAATAVPVATVTASPSLVSRTAMLVVDISGSMEGAGLDGAKQAASAFMAALPADVRVGLVTVSTTATLVETPTTDHAKVLADVQALKATGNTALYDGTLLALQALGTSGSRTIVLLTDGHDEGSKAGLDSVVTALKGSGGVVVDAVSFGTASAQIAPLEQITGATAGRVVATNQAADFAELFRQAARDIATELVITAQVPRSLAGVSVTIGVTARAGPTTLSDTAFLPLATLPTSSAPPASAGPRPVAVKAAPMPSRTVIWLGVAALFVGLAALFGTLAWNASMVDARETRVRRRLSFYTLTGRAARAEPQTTALGDSSMARSAVQIAGRLVVSRQLDARLGHRLDRAGVPLKPAEWVVIQAACAVGATLLFGLLGGGSLGAGFLGLLIGVAGPVAYLVLKQSRRAGAFLEQLPDTLQLIAGSLSVGHSLAQAMDAVVREELVPVSVEFNRALVETRLGVPPEDALDGIATRMGSQDFAWVVMAIRVQRDVGGNLAEILTTVATTIRERQRLRRQVRGLSAEGRLSAWILGALPFVFGTYLVLVRPEYIRPLFTDPLGIILLVIMLISMTVGVVWLSRVVKVDV